MAPHGFSLMFIQACIAILILVGFESVTSMGEEAKNAKRDIPRAVLLSLGIQGLICYLVEYFAANYFLNGYTLANAGASGAPIGDMMVMVGTWLFGSYAAGRAFMLVQAFTVFLALIGTTLSCLSTGARVTYAMGRDEEVPAHFGMLHGKTLTPHRSIWTLAIISAVIGIVTVAVYLGGTTPAPLDPKYHSIWYSFGIFTTRPPTPSCPTRWSSSRWSATSAPSCSTCSPASSRSWPSTSTTCSMASSTCSCRCSGWWPTWSACCST